MNRVNILIITGLVVITACMGYLIYRGISLRSAPLIQPSVVDADLKNVAHSTVQRLHREFEDAHYVVIGLLPETVESGKILRMMADEYEKVFSRTVKIVEDNAALTPEILEACEKPCWILTGRDQAHALGEKSQLRGWLEARSGKTMSISLLSYTGNEEVSAFCHEQKRLTFECLRPVSVREVRRRMKKPAERYFFMRQYLENDFFLFIQEPPPAPATKGA